MSIFDAIKVAGDLERATLETLEAWWPVYSRELTLQSPPAPDPDNIPDDALPQPKAWLTVDQLDREAADALPCIVCVSPGLSGRTPPKQEGDGSFRVNFSIGIGVFVGANDRKDTLRLVRLYTAIARTIMLQKQSLGGFAAGTTWIDESYDDNFPFTDDQTISAGQVVFEVEVDGVVNRFGGPSTGAIIPTATPDPVTQPGSTWPLVADAKSTVEILED